MEPYQLQDNQAPEGLPEVEPPRQRRFRIIKLEERIAPKKGGNLTKKCATGDCTADCPSGNYQCSALCW